MIGKLASTIVAAMLAATGAYAQPCNPHVTGTIIDVHMHLYANGSRWLTGLHDPFTHAQEPARTQLSHIQNTLDWMHRCGIVRGIVSSNDHDVDSYAMSFAPGMFVKGYKLDAPEPEDLETIRRDHAEAKITIIGEVGSQYEGIKPDDARMEPLWTLAEEFGIPVGIHMGPGGEGVAYARAPGYRMADSNALLLEPVLLKHPKMRIFVMHAGWPMGDAMVGLLYAHPQVYVDISADDWVLPDAEFHAYLARLVNAGFGKRIMFGSDQMAWPEEIARAVRTVQDAPLTRTQKRDIFYNNAMRFFGWKDLPPPKS